MKLALPKYCRPSHKVRGRRRFIPCGCIPVQVTCGMRMALSRTSTDFGGKLLALGYRAEHQWIAVAYADMRLPEHDTQHTPMVTYWTQCGQGHALLLRPYKPSEAVLHCYPYLVVPSFLTHNWYWLLSITCTVGYHAGVSTQFNWGELEQTPH